MWSFLFFILNSNLAFRFLLLINGLRLVVWHLYFFFQNRFKCWFWRRRNRILFFLQMFLSSAKYTNGFFLFQDIPNPNGFIDYAQCLCNISDRFFPFLSFKMTCFRLIDSSLNFLLAYTLKQQMQRSQVKLKARTKGKCS